MLDPTLRDYIEHNSSSSLLLIQALPELLETPRGAAIAVAIFNLFKYGQYLINSQVEPASQTELMARCLAAEIDKALSLAAQKYIERNSYD